MVVRGKFKLIWDLRQSTGQLFDLESDQRELHDLSSERAPQSVLLRSELDRWIDDRLRDAEHLGAGLAAPQVPEPILRARLGDAEAADPLVAILAKPGGLPERREAARLLLRRILWPARLLTSSCGCRPPWLWPGAGCVGSLLRCSSFLMTARTSNRVAR